MTATTATTETEPPIEELVKCDLYFEVAQFALMHSTEVGEFGERLIVVDEDWTICLNAERTDLLAEPEYCAPAIVNRTAIVAWHMGLACLEIFPHAVTAARTSEGHDGGNLREAMARAMRRITH